MSDQYQPPLRNVYDKTDHPDPAERFVAEGRNANLIARYEREFRARRALVAGCVGALKCKKLCSLFDKEKDPYAAHRDGALEEPEEIEKRHNELMTSLDMVAGGECGGARVHEEDMMAGDVVVGRAKIVHCGLDAVMHEGGPQG